MINRSPFRSLGWGTVWTLTAAVACEGPTPSEPPGPAGGPQVIAHTDGAMPKAGAIHVEFDRPMDPSKGGPRVDLTLRPRLEGSIEWIRGTRLRFRPNVPLQPDRRYEATVRVDDRVLTRFSVFAVPQAFEVRWSGLDPEAGRFGGEITTRDSAPSDSVRQMLTAELDGEPLKAQWSHSADGTSHRFEVVGIRRSDSDRRLTLQVDGQPLDLKRDIRTHQVSVPARSRFSALSARVHGRSGPIEVRFSDALASNLRPAGLFSVASRRSLRFQVTGSVVRIYSSRAWADEEVVTVSGAIRDRNGRRLAEPRTFRLKQPTEKPAVRFAGKGVILAARPGAALPIETTNLRAVRVRAWRIPPSNLGQFFQVNPLNGTQELERVGRVVWERRVELDEGGGDDWGLDLSPLVEKQGQGLYHLELSFRPEDITYDCPAGSFDGMPAARHLESDDMTDWAPDESSNWDFAWGAWISGISPGERYRQRNNPCHPAYYLPQPSHDIRVKRNVLLTHVAVVAKQDPAHRLRIWATDLRTAAPLSGAQVRVFDFAHGLLSEGRTDPNGMLRAEPERAPYTVLVRHEGELGALRLHDGESLAVSHFDVGGADLSEGLRGFLYGERGVWRPGDPIHLFFVLQDPEGRLPKDHPVHFTLRDPRGGVVDSRRLRPAAGRFYRLTTRTGSKAPTGVYRAQVAVGGTTFGKDLPIESVVPNRLEMKLDFGTELLLGPTAKLDAPLEARWLHGAAARGLQAEIEASFRPVETSFPEYGDFTFDDPTRSVAGAPQTVFSGRLDEQGRVRVRGTLELDGEAPGMALARFTTRVFEPSGQSSSQRFGIRFSPHPRYIGVDLPKGDRARGMLRTDVDHPVRIAAVDPRGEPVDTEVNVRIYEIHWRWWWEKGEEDLSQYAGTVSRQLVAEDQVEVRNGRGEWTFRIAYPSWGRYLLLVEDANGSHRTGRVFYADWPGWAGRGQRENPGGPAVLTVQRESDDAVQVGREFSVTFPSARGARALVTLESGRRVLASTWVDTKAPATRYTWTATPQMAPNVYAHVMLLQPLDGRKNDHPLRLYGVVPISVRDPKTVLEPRVEAPKEMEPATTQVVKVREAGGRPMTYTLALVDEGLLGLTRFRTPDPWRHFHRRAGLGVRTWDNYDRIAGAFSGPLETLLAVGGGETGDTADEDEPRRFPPVVIVEGPFSLNENETRAHELRIPSYVGKVRAMVVAGNDRAYGSADQQISVRKPLMLHVTAPPVVSPDDRVELPVTIFSSLDGKHEVDVRLEIEGDAESMRPTRTVSFSGPGDRTVQLPMTLGSGVGPLRLRVTAAAGSHRHVEEISLPVRHPTLPEVTVVEHTVKPGETWSPRLSRPGLESPEVELEIYRDRPFGLGRRLAELVAYPHGCLEQTVSRAFPQVFLSRLQVLDPKSAQAVRGHVNAAIDKLRLYQSPSGGFGMWPGSGVHAWTSVWAGHFLLEARRLGFVVPQDLLERWQRDQRERAMRFSELAGPRARLTQAYRLYALALAGTPDTSSMNRLREAEGLDRPTALRLAAAYGLTGLPDVARSLATAATTAPSLQTGAPDPTLGSPLRDKAMALETFLWVGDSDRADQLAEELASILDSDRAISTQEASQSLLALSRWAAQQAGEEAPTVEIRAAGETESVSLETAVVRRRHRLDEDAELTIRNRGRRPLSVRLVRRGHPDPDDVEAFSRGLEIESSWNPSDGFVRGEDVRTTVRITNTTDRHLSDLALTQAVPSGFEIRNDRFAERRNPEGEYVYRDIRDDRLHTYFELAPGASKTFDARLHATFAGRFRLPPVRVESMYDVELQAQTGGRWVTVNRSGQTP